MSAVIAATGWILSLPRPRLAGTARVSGGSGGLGASKGTIV